MRQSSGRDSVDGGSSIWKSAHRDPSRVVPSFCSMMSHGRRIFSDDVDPHEVGAQLFEKALRAVTRSMQVREQFGSDSFLDVAYAELVSDPLKQIRRIYDFIGTELVPEAEEAMQHWLDGNPQNKHGVHRYRASDFGLDESELDRRFEPYRERYGIPAE